MATYKHLRSSTANKRPTTSIADGQLAINTNTASPGLFFKDSAGTGIVKVGPVHVGTTAPNSVPASGGSTGNYLGEQWLDTSVSPAQMKVWNGSAWIGVVADELPVSKLQDGSARQLLQTDAAGTGVEWTSNVDVPGTLDVSSTATFDSIASHPLGSAGAPTITFTGDTNTGIYSPGADQVAISTNGTERARIDSLGRLLVGTSTASTTLGALTAKLQVQGTSVFDTGITNALWESSSNPTQLQLVKSRGASIGTQTVVQNNDTLGRILFGGSDGTDFETAAWIQCDVDGTPGANDMPGRLVFSTTADGASSPTERMRITSSGGVLVGTTSSVIAGATIFSAISANLTAQFGLSIATTQSSGTGALLQSVFNNTQVGSITNNSTSTAYNTSSDYRLKENTVPLTGAINRINQLQVHRFNFIADPSKTVDGFIAHEAQEVVPECVTGTKDEVDDEGNPVYQGIDQSKLVPLLTAALQEAIAKIESLEARLTAAGI